MVSARMVRRSRVLSQMLQPTGDYVTDMLGGDFPAGVWFVSS